MTAPEVVLARHAEANSSVARVIAGPSCTGLTAAGRDAATQLGWRLRRLGGFGRIHASPTRRARETADIVGTVLGLPVEEHAGLRVPDPGAAEGLTWAVVRSAGRAMAAGAEPWADYLARAEACLQRIAEESGDDRTLVVGHTETVVAAFTLWLGTANLGRLRIWLDYTALTRFRRLDTLWELISHNDLSEQRT